MNIQIQRKGRPASRLGLLDYLLPFFSDRSGFLSVVIFTILVVEESHYRRVIYGDGSLFGGLGSSIGICMLLGSAAGITVPWIRYRQFARDPKYHAFVAITEDYMEEGVDGLWQKRFHWPMLMGFKESDTRFILKMRLAEIIIEKRDLIDVATPDELRSFLNAKMCPKGSVQNSINKPSK